MTFEIRIIKKNVTFKYITYFKSAKIFLILYIDCKIVLL